MVAYYQGAAVVYWLEEQEAQAASSELWAQMGSSAS